MPTVPAAAQQPQPARQRHDQPGGESGDDWAASREADEVLPDGIKDSSLLSDGSPLLTHLTPSPPLAASARLCYCSALSWLLFTALLCALSFAYWNATHPTRALFGLPSGQHDAAASLDVMCHSRLYADGEWVHSDNEWYAYQVGESGTLACDASGSNAIWQFNASQRNTTTLPPPAERLNTSQMYVRPAIKYVWTPTACSLARFPLHSPVDFCLALASRPLLFVGDSLSYQHYQSLIFMLGEPNRDDQRNGGNRDCCVRLLHEHYTQQLHRLCSEDTSHWPYANSSRVCTDGRWMGEQLPVELNSSHVRVRFARNDHLSAINVSRMYDIGARTDMETPWRHLVTPDALLVINSGAHVEPPDVYRAQVTEVLQWMRTTYPCATVFWRNTVPGHADCTNPLNQLPLTQARYAHFDRLDQMSHTSDPTWGWQQIRGLNAIAHDVLRSASSSAVSCPSSPSTLYRVGGLYELDVYSFDKLRPDAHRPHDCLHQCLPGPVDTYNRLLYNILIGRAS